MLAIAPVIVARGGDGECGLMYLLGSMCRVGSGSQYLVPPSRTLLRSSASCVACLLLDVCSACAEVLGIAPSCEVFSTLPSKQFANCDFSFTAVSSVLFASTSASKFDFNTPYSPSSGISSATGVVSGACLSSCSV